MAVKNPQIKVVVGSTNPVKVEAVRAAFEMVWPEQAWEVVGVPAASHVSDQPMSDEECIIGARNRAKQALIHLDAAYAVGLEGGLQQTAGQWFNGGWIIVIDSAGREGIGSTIKTIMSARMMELIEQGMELGVVDDLLFQQQNSKQADGHFGLLTRNLITRKKAYVDGVVTALIRFMQPDLFADRPPIHE
jgi:inosine/xanthosine triphosphatase